MYMLSYCFLEFETFQIVHEEKSRIFEQEVVKNEFIKIGYDYKENQKPKKSGLEIDGLAQKENKLLVIEVKHWKIQPYFEQMRIHRYRERDLKGVVDGIKYTTKNGEIIASHSTLFNPLIAEKCNIILDVKPSRGYRFIMTTYPGAIWSCEDYYQNERGIILTETELPQGPWTKKGVPKGVRSRNAIQYSSNIDEVISYLMKGNNGLIPNEWLVGDTKTGEIASLEQALFNTPIKRTFNGFYWSCNYPHNQKVKRELYGISSFLLDISMKIMSNNVYFAKIKRLMKIADEMYGNIDIKNAKKILATDPLSYSLTDGKITSTTLMNNMTFLAHLGNPDGSTWVPTQDFKNK